MSGNVWCWMDTDVTKQLTPWSRVIPGKLTGPKLVKKLLAFCGTRMFITSFARARHLSIRWARSCQRIDPSPRPCEMFLNVPTFTVRSCLAPRPKRSWSTTSCRVSATTHWIYLQLPSISGGRSSIRKLRTRHAVLTGTHLSRNYVVLFN